MAGPTITRVRTIATSPGEGNIQRRLIVVKVETSEPGLYGLGCATFTQRHSAVRTVVDEFLAPLLVGRDPRRIEDIWQTVHVNAYWRSGPVMNNALSGVDMALWDILGKLAGLPVYQLLGGKCREGAAVYRHADGATLEQVEERVRQFMAQGYQYIRAQWGGYGGRQALPAAPDGAMPGAYYDPDGYARSVVTLFDHLREALGFGVNLLHDVHERLAPIEAVRLAKLLEPHRLFFLEDLLPPEQVDWFRLVRQQCTTPMAMGELFVNTQEWRPLVEERLIDFIRCHISAIGGLTAARKIQVMCELMGVRTAWHGPGDVSPIGHACNVHLDVMAPNFGVQEWAGFLDVEREMFPGCPELRDGYVYPNDKPGWGMDMDEALAAKYPCPEGVLEWTQARLPDGSPAYP
ncbi:MAG: starvation-sensing protein RspA [candidate division WS1 bacterium]|jgi:mannonate dehydratase|nr:starvation-sensing protein RspA [candidate division WS1 bacterium]